MQQAEGEKPLSISLDHTRSLTIEKGKCIWFSWSNAFFKQILSIWFWGNLAQAELSGDSRMFITCSFGGQHLCHSSLWHHSFYCKWLQCKSVRRSKHKPMKMRHAGMMLQGHFYCLCQVCLFLMADRFVCFQCRSWALISECSSGSRKYCLMLI